MSGKNIIPHFHNITKEGRNKLLGNSSFAVWFTGLSGSGKSTLAGKLEELLYEKGILTYLLDGDNIRSGINKDLGFSEQERNENIRRIGEVTKILVDSGVVVLTALISPFKEDRKTVRSLLGEKNFIEVYVKCPVEVCEKRDPKGLYKKARAGEIKKFTGIDSAYEEPENPEIIIDTNNSSVEDSVNRLIDLIGPKLYL